MALTDSLISYWKLDEASGTRYDSHGTNDLTDNNTVGSATGKVGNAADFIYANTESLTKSDNSDLSVGDIDFTICAWVKFDQLLSRATTYIATKDDDWRLYGTWDGAILFSVTAPSEATTSATATSISNSVWYFVVAWHDSVNNEIGISINNGTPITTSWSNGIRDSNFDFKIGHTMDGLIDEVGFWKRVLTSAERAALYNNGIGLSYDRFAASSNTSNLYNGLMLSLEMDEASGNAIDSHSYYDFSENGTVPSVTGWRDFEYGDALGNTFSRASTSAFNFGDTDFTIAVEATFESLGYPNPVLFTKYNWQASLSMEWGIGTEANVPKNIAWSVSGDGDTFTGIQSAVVLNTTDVFHVIVWHDSTNNQIGISVNNETPVTASHSTGVYSTNTAMYISRDATTDANAKHDGKIRRIRIWNRLLTSDERTQLYNNGNGLSYDGFASSSTVNASSMFLWNLYSAASLNENLKWNISSLVNNDTSTKWNIYSLVESHQNYLYNLYSLVNNSNSILWNMRSLVTGEEGVVWNVLFTVPVVSRDLMILWNMLRATNNSNQILWNQLTNVNNSNQLVWNIYTTVSSEKNIKWNMYSLGQLYQNYLYNIYSLVNESNQLLWNQLVTANNSNEILWNIYTVVNNQNNTKWDIRSLVNNSPSILWDIRSLTNNSNQLLWNIRANVTNDEQLLWNIRQIVNNSDQLLWNIYQTATNNNSLLWNIRIAGGNDTNTLWNLRARVLSDEYIVWDVLSIVPVVNRDVMILWNITSQANNSFNALWNLRSFAYQDSNIIWNQSQSANTSINNTWNVLTKVTAQDKQYVWNIYQVSGNSNNSLWNIRQLAGANPAIYWNIRQNSSTANNLLWNINTVTNKDIQSAWNIRVLVGSVEQCIWNIRQAIPADFNGVWNTRAILTNDNNLVWNISTKTGNNTSTLWDIRNIGGGNNTQTIWNISALVQNGVAIQWNVLPYAISFIDFDFRIVDDLRFNLILPTNIDIGE